jgi:hypothetical protein
LASANSTKALTLHSFDAVFGKQRQGAVADGIRLIDAATADSAWPTLRSCCDPVRLQTRIFRLPIRLENITFSM